MVSEINKIESIGSTKGQGTGEPEAAGEEQQLPWLALCLYEGCQRWSQGGAGVCQCRCRGWRRRGDGGQVAVGVGACVFGLHLAPT